RESCHGEKECMRALARISLRFDGTIELFGKRQARQTEFHPFRLAKRNPHVLEKVLDEETRLEIAGDCARRQIAQAPGSGSTRGDALKHDIEIQIYLERVKQCLTNTNHVACDQNLVDHFRVLARTGAALV